MALFNLLGKLGLDATGFNAGLKKAESATVSFGRQVKNQIGGYLTAGVFAQLTRSAVEYGSKIKDLSDRLGISSDALQEFAFAAKQSGSNLEEVAGFLEKLSTSRAAALGGNTGIVAAFKQLGVTVDQLRSARIEDIARTIGKAFEGGDPQAFVGALREVGGRGAGGLIPAMAAGLSDAADQAHRLGQIMSEEVVNAADEVGDKMDSIATGMKNVWATALVGLGKFTDRFVGAAYAWGQTIKEKWQSGDKAGALNSAYNPVAAFEAMKQGWVGAIIDDEADSARRAARKRGLGAGGFGPGGMPGGAAAAAGFSGIPGAGYANQGGFFFGADASLRSVPLQQLEVQRGMARDIADIKATVTDPDSNF